MTKLLILDKDGTLITTKSGETFVQHLQDQKLLPNVLETLQRYAADGWKMAIASNQGGCSITECAAIDFPVGAYYVEASDPSNYPVKVAKKETASEGVVLHTATPRKNGKEYLWFEHTSKVHFQYKTLSEAIAEMHYCLGILPMIDCAIFAPYYDGCVAWRVWADRGRLPDEVYTVAKTRKPGTGMLHLAASNCDVIFSDALMVGDRTEDQQAAAAAGVQFQWAKDFFGGSS